MHLPITINEVRVLIGDCRKTLRYLPEKSINCCVTSPPYFGLRDYGHDEQLGHEQTPEEFVENLVEVFREVRRVLTDDGTLWLNIGDSYSGSGKGPAGNIGKQHNERHLEHKTGGIIPDGTKRKDLIGIPWMLAFALRADGWFLRQDIIWHKPNPMPESVRDRCTKSHEHVFLLSKSPKYFFDSEAIKEPSKHWPNHKSVKQGGFKGKGAEPKTGQKAFRAITEKRNKRDVWTIQTRPYKGAHFATFPPELAETCILAGCPEGGTVLDPFGGSGTTAMVAHANGLEAVLCELNPEYVDLIRERLS